MHSGASKRSEPTLIVRPSGSYQEIIQPCSGSCTENQTDSVVLDKDRGLFCEFGVLIKVITVTHYCQYSDEGYRAR